MLWFIIFSRYGYRNRLLISKHHMLWFIGIVRCWNILIPYFKTSYVMVYHTAAKWMLWKHRISKHHMLWFIKYGSYVRSLRLRISKHHMLWFIGLVPSPFRPSSAHFKTSYVMVYRRRNGGFGIRICNFKTSYVMVYQEKQSGIFNFVQFQNIICYGLSRRAGGGMQQVLHFKTSYVMVYLGGDRFRPSQAKISKHHMLWFILYRRRVSADPVNISKHHMLWFIYWSCIRFLREVMISKHHMLWFIDRG